jgi:hypothetical protein
LIDRYNAQTSRSGQDFPIITQAGTLSLALNETDDDIRFGDCASITYDNATPIRDQATQVIALGSFLRLRTPTVNDAGNFVVAAENIPQYQSGFVYTDGIILARLQAVGSGDDADYCDVDTEDGGIPAVLKKQSDGTARVLDVIQESPEADVDWALIKFPVTGNAAVLVWEATSDEEYGEITAQRVNLDGTLSGEERTFQILAD